MKIPLLLISLGLGAVFYFNYMARKKETVKDTIFSSEVFANKGHFCKHGSFHDHQEYLKNKRIKDEKFLDSGNYIKDSGKNIFDVISLRYGKIVEERKILKK